MRLVVPLSLAALLAGSVPVAAQEAPTSGVRTYTIAVVRDGPPPDTGIRELVEDQVRLLAPRGVEARFTMTPELDAQWDAGRARQAIQTALDDPDVDYLLLEGALVSQTAQDMDLTKPVVSSFVERLDHFQLHDMEADRSRKDNLSFILVSNRAETDVAAFRDLLGLSTLHVALDAAYIDGIDVVQPEMDRIAAATGVTLEFVRVEGDPEAALAAVPADAEAVMLGTAPRLLPPARARFFQGLTERGIAALSIYGYSDVDAGALAARSPNVQTQAARRAAVNLTEMMRGVDVADLPVLLSADTRILLNGRTAAAIGYAPDFETIAFATIRHEEALRLQETPLRLEETLRMAEAGNVELSIETNALETARIDQNVARSPLLPQVAAQPQFRARDPASIGLEGLIPASDVVVGFGVSQMLYDDAAISDYRSQKRLYETSGQTRESRLLDTYEASGSAFLRFVLARILYAVDLDNVRLTEENLELARLRQDVGYSGRDEVFRWEAELANRRAEVFASRSLIERNRVDLNQVLGIAQDTRWRPEELRVEEDAFPFLDGRVRAVFVNAATFNRFRERMVQFSVQNSPELRGYGFRVEAQEIQVGQRERTWWLPTFSATAGANWRVAQSEDIPGLASFIPQLELTARYPIFLGAARPSAVGRERSELRKISDEARLARDLVEKRTRIAMRRMESSFPAIQFARAAARAARQNFELVQDKYGQGLVNVTDLLEAQNASFLASQAEVAAVYEFLLDLNRFQRAIGWFEPIKTDQEKDMLAELILGEEAN